MYVFIGGLGHGLDLAVFLLCRHYWALDLPPSNIAARGAGAIATFFGNRAFTFGVTGVNLATLAKQSLRYLLLWIGATTASTAALLAVAPFHSGPLAELGWKIVVEVVIVVSNFLISRYWVFKHPPPSA